MSGPLKIYREVLARTRGNVSLRCIDRETCDAGVFQNPPAWLAGEAPREMGLNRVERGNLGKDMFARARKRLANLLSLGRLRASSPPGAAGGGAWG